MKKLSNNKAGIGTAAIVLIAVVVLIVAGAGIYALTKMNNDGDDNNSETEPMINGVLGIGSKVYYSATTATHNDADVDVTTFESEIIGETGSYYLVKFHLVAVTSTTSTFDTASYLMIHKSEGYQKYGTDIEEKTVDGVMCIESNTDPRGISVTTLTRSSDGVLFGLTLESSSFKYVGIFESDDMIESGDTFETSPDLGKYQKVQLTYGYGDVILTLTDIGILPDGNPIIEECFDQKFEHEGVTYPPYHTYYPISEHLDAVTGSEFSVKDVLLLLYEIDPASLDSGTTGEIDTCDGTMLCDVYKVTSHSYGDVEITVYIGADNGITYLLEFSSSSEREGLIVQAKLLEYDF